MAISFKLVFVAFETCHNKFRIFNDGNMLLKRLFALSLQTIQIEAMKCNDYETWEKQINSHD